MFKDKLDLVLDDLEKLFFEAVDARTAAKGEIKTKLRKVTNELDKAFCALERVEDYIKENDLFKE